MKFCCLNQCASGAERNKQQIQVVAVYAAVTIHELYALILFAVDTAYTM
jgi:hypothetical protein